MSKTVNLINGEALDYAHRRKREIIEQLHIQRQIIAQSTTHDDAPTTWADYHRHYAVFDHMPFAFADIEMVFNKDHSAVEWIFRYGNPALAVLEKHPLEALINHSFSSIFPIWMLNGFASMNAQHSTAKHWKSSITVRKLTVI